MRSLSHKLLPSKNNNAFTLVEVLIAIVVCLLFGLAAFATNERLLVALKTQKETAAANMFLQARMETFRSFTYSNVATKDYVKTNVVQAPPQAPAPNNTLIEAPLGSLSETITVSGYTAIPSYTPVPASDYNQWIRNPAHANGQEQHHNDNLATNYNLLQVDILISWTSANGRTRTRDLSAVFGKGNTGP